MVRRERNPTTSRVLLAVVGLVLLGALGGLLGATNAAATLPSETTSCPPGKVGKWEHIDGHLPFRIWYDKKGASHSEIGSLRHESIELAGQLQHKIWPEETKVMGVKPLLGSAQRLKPAVDICLVESVSARGTENLGDTQARSRGGDCNFAHPQDILLPLTYKHRALSNTKLRDALAHEFFHALQKSLPNGACKEAAWWREATATWAIEYLYPGEDRDLTNSYAPAYFGGFFAKDNNGRFSIDQASSQGGSDLEQYGAYVLPWYLAKTLSPHVIGETWHLIAGGATVDSALSEALGSGGLRKLWPKFIAENWVEPPLDLFKKWDSGFDTGASKVNPPSEAQLNRAVDITPLTLPHLSGGFWAWKIPAGARTVAFLNQPPFYSPPDGSDPADPDAQVEAAITRSGKTERQTLTGQPGLADCFKLSGGHVDQLLLAFANSKADGDLTIPADSPQVIVTNDGCSKWSGTVDVTTKWTSGQYSGLSEKSHASVTFEPSLSAGAGNPVPHGIYASTGGKVTWSISGTDSNGCVYSGSDSYGLTASDGVLQLGWNTGSGMGPATYIGGIGDAFIGRPTTVNQACPPDYQPSSVDWTEVTPWISNSGSAPTTLQDNGLTMSDSNTYQSDEATSTWRWRLTSPG